MPKIDIIQAHDVTADEAKKRIEEFCAEFCAKYGFTSKWSTCTEVKLERTDMTVLINIEAQRVVAKADLSFAFSPLRGKVEAEMRGGLEARDRVLER